MFSITTAGHSENSTEDDSAEESFGSVCKPTGATY